MKQFDLFKLHSEKDRPKGWIWVHLDTSSLKTELLRLLKSSSQNNVSKLISKRLNCGFSTIGKHIIKLKNSKGKTDLPLPFIIELINIINPVLKNKVIDNFEYFLCKVDKTHYKVKSVKFLDNRFSSIIGSHISDGYLQKESNNVYRIKICDGRKDVVEIFSKLLKELFGVDSRILFTKGENLWICWYNNKIVGRYYENILGIKPGKKSYIVKEPEIIKNSNFEIRKSFVKGVLMFDGGVKSSGTVSLTSMSKQLIDDMEGILKLDGIGLNKRYNPKKKSWLIESKSGRNKEYLKKWLYYFEEGTWKYERLKFFIENRKYNIKELEYLFPHHHRSKIKLKDVYNVMKKVKSGKIQDIVLELDKFKISPVTVYKYLHILDKSGLLQKEIEYHVGPKNGWNETVYKINGNV